MIKNPFPGPQPYRASDRDRFYGREELSYRLEANVVSNRCVTVYGPSGAGKSSLMQASVIPKLVDSHEISVAWIAGWPEGKDPTDWLSSTMYAQLDFGEPPEDLSADEAISAAAKRAARRSSRLLLVYLDQIEQLLYASRSAAEADAFFEAVHRLVELQVRNVRVVFSLREDYLGRFRDRLRDRGRLLDHGFRVGPLTVAKLCEAVCKAAAAGEPSQSWSPEEMHALMLQMCVPGQAASGEAEVQAAYAQIVCRTLFQERAGGDTAAGGVEAEPILRRYLDATLDKLGPLRLAAQRLLENQLVTADGARTLRTEKELLQILPSTELWPILRELEGAAILHAEEHQGSRYFELGHDWLARKVQEQRREREREDEQQRREKEQQEELLRERKEAETGLAKARAQRRTLLIIAVASVSVTAVTGALGFVAWTQKRDAEAARKNADLQSKEARQQKENAVAKQIEAHDASIMAGYRELVARNRSAWAIKLLPEVQHPEQQRSWVALASDALNANALRVTLAGHKASLSGAVFSPNGKRVLTASADGTARVWSADGTGQPTVLEGNAGRIVSAVFSPDGTHILTVSVDGKARVWSSDSKAPPVVLKADTGIMTSAAFSPDGKRVAAAFSDGMARVYAADGSGEAILLKGQKGPLTAVRFLPDNARVLTASRDGTVYLWMGKSSRQLLKGNTKGVAFLTVSPDGKRFVTTSPSNTVRVWDVDGDGPTVRLEGHKGAIYHAAVSPDSKYVATASGDGTARVWSIDGNGEPVILEGHSGSVHFVAFRPDGKYLATASDDKTARLWPLDRSASPLVLIGHDAPVRSAVWSPDGRHVLTAAGPSESSADHTAKVWSAEPLQSLPRVRRGGRVFHSAFIGADGDHVAAAYDDNTARLFRVGSSDEPVPFQAHKGWVASAALSPSGDRVVTASFDKTARVYRVGSAGAPLAVLEGHKAELRFAAFSPDGTRIVTVSDDTTARVYRADGTGAPVVLEGHEDWLTSAAWSPDGQRIVTTSLDHTARVWNADGSGARIVLRAHVGNVLFAAWSPPDGARIVTVSDDRTARIWRADGLGTPEVLSGHESAVLRAVWRGDGKCIATSSETTLRLWHCDDSGEPTVLETKAPVVAMAFQDGGKTLLTVASDNTAHTWVLDVKELNRRLREAHSDCLPPDVRVTYLGEPLDTARARHDACEQEHGRMPVSEEGKAQ